MSFLLPARAGRGLVGAVVAVLVLLGAAQAGLAVPSEQAMPPPETAVETVSAEHHNGLWTNPDVFVHTIGGRL